MRDSASDNVVPFCSWWFLKVHFDLDQMELLIVWMIKIYQFCCRFKWLCAINKLNATVLLKMNWAQPSPLSIKVKWTTMNFATHIFLFYKVHLLRVPIQKVKKTNGQALDSHYNKLFHIECIFSYCMTKMHFAIQNNKWKNEIKFHMLTTSFLLSTLELNLNPIE